MGGLLALTVILSYLMVSTIRYRSFKDLDLRRRRPAWILLVIAAFFAIVAVRPELALASLAAAFVLSGPAGKLAGYFRRVSPPSS
jgi:CDP-diacylglycerol--serine O-phosphatidyltransferase